MLVAACGLAAAAPARAEAIPAEFRGHWAADAAACRDRDQANSLWIRRDSVALHQMQTVKGSLKIQLATGAYLVIANDMRGEGRTVPVTLTMRLAPDGQSLTWAGFGADPKLVNAYTRCLK